MNTTPSPALYQIQTQTTPRTTYRDTQPPATTYRPAIQFFTQKAAPVTFSKPSQLTVEPITKTALKKPIDFAAEFQKFQSENHIAGTTTPRASSNLKTYRPQTSQKIELPNASPNPIYETQLVFDPQTGQIDSSLFPQNVAYRIPASFVQQQQQQPFHPSPQIVTLEQLQQQQSQPIYQRPLQVPTTRSPLQFPQFSQQVCILSNNFSFISSSLITFIIYLISIEQLTNA